MAEQNGYDIIDLHRRALEGFWRRLEGVNADQWDLSTPCSDWDVTALVEHVIVGTRWVPPLLEEKTTDQIGDDVSTGVDDALTDFDEAQTRAVAAFQAFGAVERTVHTSGGDIPGAEYAWQRLTDVLIHTWDLSRATGGDERLDPVLVEATADWFDGEEEAYRQAGHIGPAVEAPPGADPQERLLGRFGRKM